jgi:hypothetical protein
VHTRAHTQRPYAHAHSAALNVPVPVQVLRLALQALAQLGTAARYDVIVQAPYWAKYPAVRACYPHTSNVGRRAARADVYRVWQLINTTTPWRRTADGHAVTLNWDPRADPDAPTTLEILTWPSTPGRTPSPLSCVRPCLTAPPPPLFPSSCLARPRQPGRPAPCVAGARPDACGDRCRLLLAPVHQCLCAARCGACCV